MLLYMTTHHNFEYLESEDITPIIEEYNPHLFATLPYACFKDTRFLGFPNCLYDAEGDEIIDPDIIKSGNEQLKKFKISNKINQHTIETFIDGFREILNINKSKIFNLTIRDFDTLICGQMDITYDLLMEHLQFIDFNNVNNVEGDNTGIQELKDLIKENMKNDTEWIEIFLMVVTGTTTIPAIGYPEDKKLRIQISEIEVEPYALHSCYNHMVIRPKIIKEYLDSENKVETELYRGFSKQVLTRIISNHGAE